jgi:hypothetical protein
MNLVDTEDYPLDSYELLEDRGFIFSESHNYSDIMDGEKLDSAGINKDCKLIVYEELYCQVLVHSCPDDGVTMGSMLGLGLSLERVVQIYYEKSSDNYNYLLSEIKKHGTLIFEESDSVFGSTAYLYKHNEKNVCFYVTRFLEEGKGMVYFIEVGNYGNY